MANLISQLDDGFTKVTGTTGFGFYPQSRIYLRNNVPLGNLSEVTSGSDAMTANAYEGLSEMTSDRVRKYFRISEKFPLNFR